MRKILFNNPWLLPVVAFLTFVGLWVAFIVFAVKHKPVEVERLSRLVQPSSTSVAS
jgi:hypothetical protein